MAGLGLQLFPRLGDSAAARQDASMSTRLGSPRTCLFPQRRRGVNGKIGLGDPIRTDDLRFPVPAL